jgi:hypothetical protein
MEILNMEEESVHAKSVVYTWTKSKRIKKKKNWWLRTYVSWERK